MFFHNLRKCFEKIDIVLVEIVRVYCRVRVLKIFKEELLIKIIMSFLVNNFDFEMSITKFLKKLK